MPHEPQQLPTNEAFTRDDFNTVAAAAARVYRISGGRGINIDQHPGGIVIKTPSATVTLDEPAQVVLVKNIGTTDLHVLDTCQLGEPIQLQSWPPTNEGSPIDLPYLYEQRVLEGYFPRDTSFGRFGICAEPMAAEVFGPKAHPGRIGKVWVDGVCLCKLTRTGEWSPEQKIKTADRADTRNGQAALQLCSIGAAQVLWVWAPAYPGNAEAARLAIIRFDSRNTDGVGTEEFAHLVNAGTMEVLQLPYATTTKLREAIVRVTP